MGTLDGSIHFSSDGQVDDEAETDYCTRDKPVRSDEAIAMMDLAHHRFSDSTLALKQQSLEFHAADP